MDRSSWQLAYNMASAAFVDAVLDDDMALSA